MVLPLRFSSFFSFKYSISAITTGWGNRAASNIEMGDAGDDDQKSGTKSSMGKRFAEAVGVISSLTAIYLFVEQKLPNPCDFYQFSICDHRETNKPVEPPQQAAVNGSIAVSVSPEYQRDAEMAALLNTDLRDAIADVAVAADGYMLTGKVSNYSNGSSGRSSFVFSWSLKKGFVEETCNPLPISFPSQMKRAAINDVAQGIKPAISQSVKFQDVRCK